MNSIDCTANLIVIHIAGPQSSKTILQSLDDAKSLQRYINLELEWLVMIDCMDAGRISISAVNTAVHFLNSLIYRRLAIVCRSDLYPLAKFVVANSLGRDKIKIFSKIFEAEAWLQDLEAFV